MQTDGYVPSGSPHASVNVDRGQDEPDAMLRFINTALRSRRTVLLATVVGALIAVGIGLLERREYTSYSSFTPQARKSPTSSSLSGLAAQFGIGVPAGDAAQVPQFYADLIRSRTILAAVVEALDTVATPDALDRKELAEILAASQRNPAVRREEAIDQVSHMVSVSVAPRTGVVQLAVTTPRPGLARRVNDEILRQVNHFNLQSRQSQAAAEREFTERRASEARAALRFAEDRLEGFIQHNRNYQGAPQLRFQFERLSRDIVIHQQVYASLAQAVEQARIEEVRDTPVITVVEAAEEPARPNSRQLGTKAVVGILLGGILGLVVALGQRIGVATPLDSDAVSEFSQLRREFVEDLKRPWRMLRSR